MNNKELSIGDEVIPKYPMIVKSYDLNTHLFTISPKINLWDSNSRQIVDTYNIYVDAYELFGVEREYKYPDIFNLLLLNKVNGVSYYSTKINEEEYFVFLDQEYQDNGVIFYHKASEVLKYGRTEKNLFKTDRMIGAPITPELIATKKLLDVDVTSLLKGILVKATATFNDKSIDLKGKLLENNLEVLLEPDLQIIITVKSDSKFLYFCDPYILKKI